jgi:predicted metal-binding protein
MLRLPALIAASLRPKVHIFVCGNTRPNDSPLGRGCGLVGEHVYTAFKSIVAREGAFRDVWVTKTACLGICPKHGATVAVYRAEKDGQRGEIFAEVEASDAEEMFAHAQER